MHYFYECKTKDQAKAKYKKLAKELHPDKGGSAQAFKDMQAEYDRFDSIPLQDEAAKSYYQGFNYRHPNAGTGGFTSYGSEYTFNTEGMRYTFNKIKEQYDKNEQNLEYHKEIQRLTQTNILQENKISRLKNECYQLKKEWANLNDDMNQLLLTEEEINRILLKIQKHWLVGRFIRWLRLI